MKSQLRNRFPIICIVLLLGNKKAPASPSGNKDRNSCGATLLAAFAAVSCRCRHTSCPVTGANRQKILSVCCSLCPQRSICCSAFHPTSTNGGSLWMRFQRYLRVFGLHM